ncbi:MULTISPECIES: hypothetical protein [unclassified Nostoc]|uniref:Lipoprotein n=1 Tax=Nostoc punctiforme NIES-2108 TaxID=1356359 RepID=A0A367RA21_NOSPU|nr:MULTISPECIES: hypothetical protein [unclassified Nostoc]MBN3875807.1 hypothetical protein [Nostoc sp. JL23]MBN3888831.1 hypothetical protein [Nostoc sp. JL31]RCJ33368.1 hypothetical protein A6769_25130 [Nostoc punctiforme NIES-2108]
MKIIQKFRRVLTALVLVLVLTTTAACSGTVQAKQPTQLPSGISDSADYALLSRGNSVQGQDFGNWVVSTAKGIVQDAYVRDNNKLGVVIAPKVRPTEVRPLAKSLLQGFHKNFPNQDLKVLMYAPDKKLILTAQYDVQSQQVEYK